MNCSADDLILAPQGGFSYITLNIFEYKYHIFRESVDERVSTTTDTGGERTRIYTKKELLKELLHGHIELEESDSEVEVDFWEPADEFSILMDENQQRRNIDSGNVSSDYSILGEEEWKVDNNRNVESSCGETFIDDSINSNVNVQLPANWSELSTEEISRATGIPVSDLQDSNVVHSSGGCGIKVPQHQQQPASKRPPLIPEDWRAMTREQFKESFEEMNGQSGLTFEFEDLDDIEISFQILGTSLNCAVCTTAH